MELCHAPLWGTSSPPKPQTIYRSTPRSPSGTSFHLAPFVSSPASVLPRGRAALSPLCSWDNPCMEKRQLASGEHGGIREEIIRLAPLPARTPRALPPALQVRPNFIPTKPPQPWRSLTRRPRSGQVHLLRRKQ